MKSNIYLGRASDSYIRQIDDLMFIHTIMNIEEFPQFITGHDDIIYHLPQNITTEGMVKKTMDSSFRRKNGHYIIIEHQSIYGTKACDKAKLYYMATGSQYNSPYIGQYIFYTGEKSHIKDKIRRYESVCYCPGFFITRDCDGPAILKSIKTKINKGEILHPYDYIHLIWMVRYGGIHSPGETLIEISEMIPHIRGRQDYIDAVKRAILSWSVNYIKDENEKSKMKRRLGLMKYELPSFERILEISTFEGILDEKDAEIAARDAKIEKLKNQLDELKQF